MMTAVTNNNKLIGHHAVESTINNSGRHSSTRLGVSSSGRRGSQQRPTSQFYQTPSETSNIRRNDAVEHATSRNTDSVDPQLFDTGVQQLKLRDAARIKPFASASVNKESSVKAKVAYNRKYNVVYLDASVSIQDFLHTIGSEICSFPPGQLFTVKWLDDDNDLCTINHQMELEEAFRLYHENHDSHLIIHVFPNVPDRPGMNCAGEDRAIKRRGAKQWEKQYLINGHVFKPKRFHPTANCALCTDRVWGLGRQGLRCQLCKVLVHKKCHRFIPFDCKAVHPSPRVPAKTTQPVAVVQQQQRVEETVKSHATSATNNRITSIISTTNRVVELQQQPPSIPIESAMTRSASISSSLKQPHSRSNSMNWPAKVEPQPSSSVPSTTANVVVKSPPKQLPLAERHFNDQQQPSPPKTTRAPVLLPDRFPVSDKGEPIVVMPPSTPVTETGIFHPNLPSTTKQTVPTPSTTTTTVHQQESVDAAVVAGAPQARMLTMKDFQLIKVIGRGSYAKVFAARFIRNSRIYAMKVIKKEAVTEDEDIDWIQTEKHVFEQASNYPFLVGLHSCFQTPSRLCFVIEFVSGGDLMFHMQRQRRLPESHARFYASEIILALNYLHRRGIIYRDLKLDNVLLDADGHIKLTDYGMCKEQIFVGSKTSTFCGTPNYIAPEILRGEHYDHSVDFWALGVLMYEMMAGRSPFDIAGAGDNPDQNQEDYLFQVILEKPIRIPRNLSVRAGQVLKNFLNKDPLQRLGCNPATGLADIQQHAFFRNNVDWERLENKLEQPPFRPTSSSLEALENFDPTFTSEPVQLTPDDEDVINKIDQTEFDGFEYVNPFIMAEDAV